MRQKPLQLQTSSAQDADRFDHGGGSQLDLEPAVPVLSPVGHRQDGHLSVTVGTYGLVEIARLAGVSVRSLYRIRQSGDGPWPPVPGTGGKRFSVEVVLRWLSGRQVKVHGHSVRRRCA